MANIHPTSGEFKFTIFQEVCMPVSPLQPNFFHLLGPCEPSKWQMFISPEYPCCRRSSYAVEREARGLKAAAGIPMPPLEFSRCGERILVLTLQPYVEEGDGSGNSYVSYGRERGRFWELLSYRRERDIERERGGRLFNLKREMEGILLIINQVTKFNYMNYIFLIMFS